MVGVHGWLGCRRAVREPGPSRCRTARLVAARFINGRGLTIRHRLGREPGRRPRGVRPEAEIRREGFQPPDPGPRGGYGPAGRFLGCGGAGRRDPARRAGAAMTRAVTILGATGSIGRSTAEVLLTQREACRVEAVVGGQDAQALALVARRLGARFAALSN